jgi:hypothetical protein
MKRLSSSSRGSLIVAALLLFSILLALGLGLMSSQSARMKVAQAQTRALQAKALCDAAWEDVRVKLGKDILFPLPVDGQDFFAYSEDVYITNDAGAREYFGSYTVVVDIQLDSVAREDADLNVETDIAIPQGIYGITCIGKVGRRTEQPEAEREIYYEIVMTDPTDLSNSFKVIRVEDRSSL